MCYYRAIVDYRLSEMINPGTIRCLHGGYRFLGLVLHDVEPLVLVLVLSS